jgi:DNA-binding MarR family transcriptional regulator
MSELDPAAELPLGHWLRRAYLALTVHVNDLLRPHDLTYSQWRVLSLVGASGSEPATQRKIQCCLGVEAASLTGVIDGLVRRGWLIRSENAADRRVNELALTAAGSDIYAEISSWLPDRVRARLQEGLSPGQVALAREVLQQIVTNLEPRSECERPSKH